MDRNVVKNVINGVNLVKIGHSWWNWSKLGHFGGQNDVICQNFGKVLKESLDPEKHFKHIFMGRVRVGSLKIEFENKHIEPILQ